jgi:hypothetical protein
LVKIEYSYLLLIRWIARGHRDNGLIWEVWQTSSATAKGKIFTQKKEKGRDSVYTYVVKPEVCGDAIGRYIQYPVL